jgi:carboxyl-terminal processing protease
MKYKRILLFYVLFFTGVALAFGFGYMTRVLQDELKVARFPIFDEAYEILKENAFDSPPPDTKVEYGMIRGMIDTFEDPYTRFVEPVQHELESDQLSGGYGGIGASLEFDPDKNLILHPFPDSPAIEAGILDGDRLLIVDDWEIQPDTPIDQVIAAIRGKEGSKIKIIISRPPHKDTLEFQIIRKEIPLPSVNWYPHILEPRLGIIDVNLIADTTAAEIENAIVDLTSRGSTHYVLDLRGNRGGLLSAGVDIARLFLIDGVIIEEQYRDQEVSSFSVEKPGVLKEIPMVVLVDGDTASAAEVIAGALKLHRRAPIIGKETFGKNTIQLVFSLRDQSSLHVTAAKWWVPDLDPKFGDRGVMPDITISQDETEIDPYINLGIEVLCQTSPFLRTKPKSTLISRQR